MVTSPRPPCEILSTGQTTSTFASTYIRFGNRSPFRLSTVLNRWLMILKAWWNRWPTQQSTSFNQNFIERMLKPFERGLSWKIFWTGWLYINFKRYYNWVRKKLIFPVSILFSRAYFSCYWNLLSETCFIILIVLVFVFSIHHVFHPMALTLFSIFDT